VCARGCGGGGGASDSERDIDQESERQGQRQRWREREGEGERERERQREAEAATETETERIAVIRPAPRGMARKGETRLEGASEVLEDGLLRLGPCNDPQQIPAVSRRPGGLILSGISALHCSISWSVCRHAAHRTGGRHRRPFLAAGSVSATVTLKVRLRKATVVGSVASNECWNFVTSILFSPLSSPPVGAFNILGGACGAARTMPAGEAAGEDSAFLPPSSISQGASDRFAIAHEMSRRGGAGSTAPVGSLRLVWVISCLGMSSFRSLLDLKLIPAEGDLRVHRSGVYIHGRFFSHKGTPSFGNLRYYYTHQLTNHFTTGRGGGTCRKIVTAVHKYARVPK